MTVTECIKHWEHPSPETIADSFEDFLQQLTGPTCITVRGQDNQRWRAISTLLHGNEPSGSMAVWHLLKQGIVPQTNLIILIASVQAALTEPRFSHRTLPGYRDLNRCFSEPFDDSQGRIAKNWIDIVKQHQPEALVDIHNTSGAGPSFAVAIHEDDKHDALAALFTHRLIITDLRLGASMELSDGVVPTVTIECGGAQEDSSHRVALQGLQHFIELDNVFAADTEWPMEILSQPVRLEIATEASICYADTAQEGYDICLFPHIERFNFGTAYPDDQLGWLGDKGLDALRCQRSNGEPVLQQLFEQREQGLYPKIPLKLFMVTTHAGIAKSDCILYAVACD